MKNIHSIEFYTGSKEELLPDFEKDFPYIASRAELDKYIGGYVPWHWHRTVELFYMESGSIEYDTPGGKILFPAGSGGMINPNVLHMTKAIYNYFIFSTFPYLPENREAGLNKNIFHLS